MGHGFCLEGREDLKPGSPAGPQVGTGAQGPRSWGFFCCQLGRGDTRHSPLLTSCCSSPHSALSPAALPGGDQVPPVFEFPGDVTEPPSLGVCPEYTCPLAADLVCYCDVTTLMCADRRVTGF